MAQEWVCESAVEGGAVLRLVEVQDTCSSDEGDVVVDVQYIAVPQDLGYKEGSKIIGPLVGTVKASSVDSFAVGDWVFAHGPWRREFAARAADVMKIDTRLDDPVHYLTFLRDDVVSLFRTLQHLPASNQDVACVLGASTANGRIATSLLKALGYSVLGIAENTEIVAADARADHVYNLADKDIATIAKEVGIDRFQVCVDCGGSRAMADACALMAPGGLVVAWATRVNDAVRLDALIEAQVTFQPIFPHSTTRQVHDERSILRDIFRKHPTPDAVQVEVGFEKLGTLSSRGEGSKLAIVQVEEEVHSPTNDVNAKVVELQRFLAEADIALRSLITDAALQRTVNEHQAALRAKMERLQQREQLPKVHEPAPVEPTPVATSTVAEEKAEAPVRVVPPPGAKFVAIDKFAWDQGGYNSPTVTVYVDLPGVGSVKDSVSCHFERSSFDLTVYGLEGKNYRLFKDNLDKDIVPAESKIIVKANKVVIKLKKVKGEFSYDHWTNLTAKRKRDTTAASKDPMGGIMDLMRDMYEEGDDQTRKLIGEAMMKAQRGEKQSPPSFDDM